MKKSLIGVLVAAFGVGLFFGGVHVANAANPAIPDTQTVTFDMVLANMHSGQWFSWSDPRNKVYENLVVLDQQYSKPSKSELLEARAALQESNNRSVATRSALIASRETLERKLIAGTYTENDLVAYLRILGGF